MDVFHQRLEQEHGESVILTPPTVPYTLHLQNGETLRIQNPSMYPTDLKVCPLIFPSLAEVRGMKSKLHFPTFYSEHLAGMTAKVVTLP